MIKKIITIFCILSFTIFYSQKYPYKFGKVSLEEIEMTECDFYPEAHSMVLGEQGILRFFYDNDDGWKFRLKTTVRKKIFDNEDSDAGNIRLRIYSPKNGSSEEEISFFKAFSYNLMDGKIERIKVSDRESYKRRINDYYVEVNYAIPNIKDGSVIEYQYEMISDFISNLKTWYFQDTDIPVAYSEFNYTIPEWFNYQINQLGTHFIGDWSERKTSESFSIRYKVDRDRYNSGLGGVSYATSEISSMSNFRKVIFKNIQPLEDEPYTTNISDIPCRLEFQLQSVNFPNRPMKIIAGTYEKFNKELLESSSLGKRLNTGGFIDDVTSGFEDLNDLEKAFKIHAHIQKHFSWNRVYNYFSSTSGRNAYKKAEGTVADINLTLIAMLRHSGIEANPIVLSTRGNGTVHPVIPNYDEFNYIIASVLIEGKQILLDASSSLPFGELPLRCRNGNGWLVDSENSGWVNLKNNANYNVTSLLNFKIDSSELLVEVSQRRKQYASYSKIDEINEATEEDFYEELANDFIDYDVQDIEIANEGYTKPLTIKYNLVKENEGEELIYIQPILLGTITENPFNREERAAPIDFPYKQEFSVISTIEIPEGYVAELPESQIVKLPDDAGAFQFIVKQNQNKISIRSKLSINKTLFLNTEYGIIKEFYDALTDKNNELVVLKKL